MSIIYLCMFRCDICTVVETVALANPHHVKAVFQEKGFVFGEIDMCDSCAQCPENYVETGNL